MKGKLVVIEGSDGSGKTTQLKLLEGYLKNSKIPVKIIDFPRYYDSFYGKVIARFLRGEFGKLEEVNPYLISIVYGLDRAQAKSTINRWLKKGAIVLSNRYIPSNLAHQSARLPKTERDIFIEWVMEHEYKLHKIPREDLVLYLYVPHQISLRLMQNQDRTTRAYTKGRKNDIVEKDREYLRESEKAYLDLVKKFSHWVKIECVDKKGRLKSKEEIHEEIKTLLAKKAVL